MNISLSPFAPDNLVSRDMFGHSVPRHPAHCPHSGRIWCLLFLLSVCFRLCSLFYRDDVLCWLLLARPFLYAFHAHLRFPVDLVWFRLSCDHGWIRSGSVNVRKQQQQQQQLARFLSLSTGASIYLYRQPPSGQSRDLKEKSDASKPSEHPPYQREKLSKRLGGTIRTL